MIKPAVVTDDPRGSRALRTIYERVQSRQYARCAPIACDPAVIDAYANGCEAEANGGDAAGGSRCAAVGHQAIVRIRSIPEIIETGSLKIVEKFVVARERMRDGCDGRR